MKNLILSVLNLLIIFVVNGQEDTISDSTFNDSKLGFGATIGITKFNYYLSQREAFIPDDIPFTELRGKQVIGTGAKDILGLNIGFITNMITCKPLGFYRERFLRL